jgi:cell division initiation protein
MRMTPLDIQSHRFRSAWIGADREEVEAFLRAVADDYETLVRENELRAEQIRRLELRHEEVSLNEALFKETLVSAQNLGDELRHSAKKQAEVMVSEAEIKAERILDAAHRRAARLAEEIRELRGLRTRLASSLRTSIETHLVLIDSLSEELDETAGLDGGLGYLGGREAAAGGNSARAAAPGTPTRSAPLADEVREPDPLERDQPAPQARPAPAGRDQAAQAGAGNPDGSEIPLRSARGPGPTSRPSRGSNPPSHERPG